MCVDMCGDERKRKNTLSPSSFKYYRNSSQVSVSVCVGHRKKNMVEMTVPVSEVLLQPWHNAGHLVLLFAVFFWLTQLLSYRIGKLVVPGFSTLTRQQQSEFAVRIVAALHCVLSFATIPGYLIPAWENSLIYEAPADAIIPRFFDSIGLLQPPVVPGTDGPVRFHAGLMSVGASLGVGDAEERLVSEHYEYSPVSQLFFAVTAGYFLWDIFISISEGWGAFFIAHAFASFGVFYSSLYPFLHYFGRYFHGVFEVSTLCLHLQELLSLVKLDSSPLYGVIRGVFVISFVLVRVLLGTYTSYALWVNCINLMSHREVHSVAVVVFVLVADIVVMSLQYAWFFEIVRKVGQMVMGQPQPADAAAKEKKAT